jgi:hypothetical protein
MMTDHDRRIEASREAFAWMDDDPWTNGTAVYWLLAAIIGMMTGGVVIVLMVLR